MADSSTSRYLIRRATGADIPALSRLGRETFAAAYAVVIPPADLAHYLDQAFAPESIAQELASGAASYLVATAAGELVGYAKLIEGPAPAGVPSSRVVELMRLYVAPGWLGEGIGTELLLAARSAAAGHEGWWLRVWERNEQAIRFYQRHGFRSVGIEPYPVGDACEPVWIMFSALGTR